MSIKFEPGKLYKLKSWEQGYIDRKKTCVLNKDDILLCLGPNENNNKHTSFLYHEKIVFVMYEGVFDGIWETVEF